MYDPITIMCRDVDGGSGVNGQNGLNGLNGVNATVSVGATATLPYGSPPIITNTGTASNAIFNFSIPEGATGSAGTPGDSGVSKTFWMLESTKEVGIAFTLQMATSFTAIPIYGYQYFQNPPALNDQWSQTFALTAGSYALFAIGLTSTNRGIITWELDGVVQGTMDYFANPGLTNTIKTIPITVLTSGVHTIRGKLISKNAASTDFFCTIQAFWIKQ
jgi:hypothetical protein